MLTTHQQQQLLLQARIDTLVEVRNSLFQQKDKLDKEIDVIAGRVAQADAHMKEAIANQDHHLHKLWHDVWLDALNVAESRQAEWRGLRNAFQVIEDSIHFLLGEQHKFN